MVNAREREESSAFGQGNALGRATERVREEARPLPPEAGRERQQRPYEAENEPRHGMQQARMREETSRQDPPFVRNGRSMPPQQHEAPVARDEGRDQRRGQPSAREAQRTPPVAVRQPAHEIAQRERAVQSAPDERRAEAEPERRNGKGKGRDEDEERDDDEETDSLDERDGDARRRNRRDE